jgi:uncharacterized protein (DUF362 family)
MTDSRSPEDSKTPAGTASLPPNHLAFVHCPNHADLANGVRQTLASFLPPTLPPKVLIKPNLCDIVSWETGVTTDPAWVGILADALRAIRPDVDIYVIESNAVSAYKTFRSCDETFERLGYTDAAAKHGVTLVNLSSADSLEIALPDVPSPISIAQLLLEECFFISIANLKVHPYSRMTAILKNSLGLVSDADISSFHPYLSQLISGLNKLCLPDLSIIDGRIGLERGGPIIGDPVSMDAIIFSNDALTADVAACALMKIPPEEVPYLVAISKESSRPFPAISVPPPIQPRPFAFDAGGGHKSILVKFANRRFHKSSELTTNRWIDRFFRFKKHPLTFAKEGIPKLIRRTYAR